MMRLMTKREKVLFWFFFLVALATIGLYVVAFWENRAELVDRICGYIRP